MGRHARVPEPVFLIAWAVEAAGFHLDRFTLREGVVVAPTANFARLGFLLLLNLITVM